MLAMPERVTFRDLINTRVKENPDLPFVTFDGMTVSFGELRERVNSVANALLGLGIEPGDTVAMLTVNCAEWVDVWLAAAEIGALSTPVNAAFRGDFLLHQLSDAKAKLILVDEQFLPLVAEVADGLHDLQVVVVRGASGAPIPPPRGLDNRTMVSAASLYAAERVRIIGGRALAWDEPSCLFYTSGTTGLSKGVVLTQHSLATSAATVGAAYGYTSADVLYGAVPLFHLSGSLGVVLPPLVCGVSSVLDSAFHVNSCWDRVREVGATVFVGVGPMGMMLFGLPPNPADAELGLRLIVAAPIPAELHRAIEERFAAVIATGYGMTEVFPLAVGDVREPGVPGSAGQANPGFEVVLLDDDDEPVPVGAVGEIACRPRRPHTMLEGYHGRPDATWAQCTTLWFHTGDFGRFDEDGNLFFVDRKKDAIRRRGENISSFEVEQSVMKHPEVAECAAHAVPSPLGEDEVKICVVLKPDSDLSPGELYEHCVARLPKFAIPRYIELLDALPKNAVGRVQKAVLRERPLGPHTWDRAGATDGVASQ